MMNFLENYEFGVSDIVQDFLVREEQVPLITNSPTFIQQGLENEHEERTSNELSKVSILQETENKSQKTSDIFPTLDEHDNEGYKFEINLSALLNRSNYSSKLNKIFIQINRSLYIDVSCIPKLPYIPLFVRVMMVFIDDISDPIHRCSNHTTNDLISDTILKTYIIRSENKNVLYTGNYNGRSINDRLSLLIPINENKSNEDNILKYLIVLKFTCQNSCIGRKRTAIIFTLEDKCSYILAKKVINIKVCSSPKRDQRKDEMKFLSKIHEIDQENSSLPKMIKIESSDCTDENYQNNHFPEIKYEMNIPTHLEFEISQAIFNIISGKIISDSKNSEKYCKYIKEAKKRINN